MMYGSDTKEFEIFLSGHKPLPTHSTFQDGELLGEWRITAFLGKGGSGEVYRAEHVKDCRDAALKVHVRRSGKSDSQENSARERFEREARILSSNSYSFFPKLYEFGESRGYLYFALELLEPISLPNTDAAIASFLLELCRAVRALHGNGLVHRDIKPQNIMRRSDGQLVLIDLGLVKESAPFTDHSGTSVTIVDGKVVGVGTLRYAAPEQFNGGVVSPATDIHALGMLANECFGGQPSRAWERIISRSTSSIPERRYGDIESFASSIRYRNVPRRVLAFATVILALVGVAVGFVLYRKPTLPYHTELNGQVRVVTDPLVLKDGCMYEVIGPGTLDADISGPTNATLRLNNCVLLNRTKETFPKNGVRYILGNGVYLNFINFSREPPGLRRRDFIAPCGGAHNEVRFGGPDTIGGLMQQKNFEWFQSLRGR